MKGRVFVGLKWHKLHATIMSGSVKFCRVLDMQNFVLLFFRPFKIYLFIKKKTPVLIWVLFQKTGFEVLLKLHSMYI